MTEWPIVIIGASPKTKIVKLNNGIWLRDTEDRFWLVTALKECHENYSIFKLDGIPSYERHHEFGKNSCLQQIGWVYRPTWDSYSMILRAVFCPLGPGIQRKLERLWLQDSLPELSLDAYVSFIDDSKQFITKIQRIHSVDHVPEGACGGRYLPLPQKTIVRVVENLLECELNRNDIQQVKDKLRRCTK